MENPFDYRITKERKVLIYRNNTQIKIVKGKWSEDFIDSLSRLNTEQIQMKLAKITGNYKRGNEHSKSPKDIATK